MHTLRLFVSLQLYPVLCSIFQLSSIEFIAILDELFCDWSTGFDDAFEGQRITTDH